jgi:hypothetical protein
MGMNAIWLASYPRSGNTFLRTILWHCFGLKSASVYPNDLGGNRTLEQYVGHIEHGPGGGVQFPANSLPLIKTHTYPTDDSPAIYVVRDGRAAAVSMANFYRDSMTLDAIIDGQHRFGTWSQHVQAWKPWERPHTLLLAYEDMRADLPATLERLGAFLKRDAIQTGIPDRNTIAESDGQWVRQESDWKTAMPAELLARFNRENEAMLKKLGYVA